MFVNWRCFYGYNSYWFYDGSIVNRIFDSDWYGDICKWDDCDDLIENVFVINLYIWRVVG